MSLSSVVVKEYVRKIEGSENMVLEENFYFHLISKDNERLSRNYLSISDFNNNMAIVTIPNRKKKCLESDDEVRVLKGVIDSSGKIIVPCVWDNAHISSDGSTIRICKDGLWGFADSLGKIICQPKFLFIEAFKGGLARVSMPEGKWGAINERGKFVISPKYLYLSSLENPKIVAKWENLYGIIDKKGNIIEPFKYNMKKGIQGDVTLSSRYDGKSIRVYLEN